MQAERNVMAVQGGLRCCDPASPLECVKIGATLSETENVRHTLQEGEERGSRRGQRTARGKRKDMRSMSSSWSRWRALVLDLGKQNARTRKLRQLNRWGVRERCQRQGQELALLLSFSSLPLYLTECVCVGVVMLTLQVRPRTSQARLARLAVVHCQWRRKDNTAQRKGKAQQQLRRVGKERHEDTGWMAMC